MGDLCNWGLLISDGALPMRAAEETIIAMISDSHEVQENVRRLVKLVFTDSSFAADGSGGRYGALAGAKSEEPFTPEPEKESPVEEEAADTATDDPGSLPDEKYKKKFSFKGGI